jgi:CheY-like chemotaxis protein
MNLKVLLVDDDEVVLLMHDLMIIESGLSAKTLAFESSTAALDFLNQQTNTDERYLIFLDIHMPVMNGWQFLDTIQELAIHDRISVIITSSSIDSSDHVMAKEYPVITEYIEKPLTAEIFARIKDRYG